MTEQFASPVYDPTQDAFAQEAMLHRLESSKDVELQTLAGESMVIPFDQKPFGYAENQQIGINQELQAIIQAGEDVFGLVAVANPAPGNEAQKTYFVTQLGHPKSRATLVGEINQFAPTTVGHDGQNSHRKQPDAPEDRFQVIITDKGVVVEDLHSSSATRVFTAEQFAHDKKTAQKERRFALRGIKRAVRTQSGRDEPTVTDLSWAPKSALIAEALKVSQSRQKAITEVESALQKELNGSYLPARFGAERLAAKAKEVIASSDEQAVRDVQEMIVHNTLHGIEIPEPYGKWTAGDYDSKVAKLIEIYKASPSTAELLVSEQIAGFHGSSSASLLNVLQHGLLSSSEARKRNLLLSTGEQTFSGTEGQYGISFADWGRASTISYYSYGNAGETTSASLRERATKMRGGAQEAHDMYGAEHPFAHNGFRRANDFETLADYLESLPPESDEAVLLSQNFPIAYGVSDKSYEVYRSVNQMPVDDSGNIERGIAAAVNSDAGGEFAVYDKSISFEHMPVVAAPQDKVEYVKQLLEKYHIVGVTVIPLELLAKKEDARRAFL